MKYSIIIPVYNRPDEIVDLLSSLSLQSEKDFEVIIVEDGSENPSGEVIKPFYNSLLLKYYLKQNSGPGQTRNYGVHYAEGEYLIFLDSDCVLHEDYIKNIDAELSNNKLIDLFGGPDRAHESFSNIQKAINYSMTSFFTTGGIRGGKFRMDKFYPRSFNMGIKKDVFIELGGFSSMRFGEDIDLSIRVLNHGYVSTLLPGAWVYHKRRTDFWKFYRQVYNSGIARINLYKKYPKSLKPVHILPTLFTVFVIISLLLGVFNYWFLLPLFLYTFLVYIDAVRSSKNFKLGFYAILSSYIQLIGYGLGFIHAWWKRCICIEGEFAAFHKSFYK